MKIEAGMMKNAVLTNYVCRSWMMQRMLLK